MNRAFREPHPCPDFADVVSATRGTSPLPLDPLPFSVPDCCSKITPKKPHAKSTRKIPLELQAKTRRLFDPGALKALDKFCRTLYSSFGVVGIAPGHPDLLVYRDDTTEVFFCEVKQGKQDMLSVGEMLGISLIHTFLGCRTEVARLNGCPRSYRWVWPALQPLHPDKIIHL